MLGTDDRIAIEQLNARYAQSIDRGDGPAWAACFGADGVFVSSRAGEVTGAEQLAEFARAAGDAPGAELRTHWIGTVLAEERDGTVNGRCYAMVVEGGAEPRIVASVIYEDELDRGEGGWRFRRRVVRIVQ